MTPTVNIIMLKPAETIKEATDALNDAWTDFKHKSSFYYRVMHGSEDAKDAHEEFRMTCQQVSGWLEYGELGEGTIFVDEYVGKKSPLWIETKQLLNMAEFVLIKYRQYSRRDLHYKPKSMTELSKFMNWIFWRYS